MDVLTAIRRPIEAELSRYKTLFEEALTHQDDYLGSALAYVRQRRGKMMRPILTILVAKNCGEVQTATLRLAVTLELLHTASLVHDVWLTKATNGADRLQPTPPSATRWLCSLATICSRKRSTSRRSLARCAASTPPPAWAARSRKERSSNWQTSVTR